eukprot:4992709-Prymnesium_polylepis.1
MDDDSRFTRPIPPRREAAATEKVSAADPATRATPAASAAKPIVPPGTSGGVVVPTAEGLAPASDSFTHGAGVGCCEAERATMTEESCVRCKPCRTHSAEAVVKKVASVAPSLQHVLVRAMEPKQLKVLSDQEKREKEEAERKRWQREQFMAKYTRAEIFGIDAEEETRQNTKKHLSGDSVIK